MSYHILSLLILFLSGCSHTNNLMKDFRGATLSRPESIKKFCEKENHATSCFKYGLHLRDSNDKSNARGTYYKKACDLGHTEACNMHKLYLTQTESYDSIKNRCNNGTDETCISGAKTLEARGDRKEAVKIYQIACTRNIDSPSCDNIRRIRDEDKARVEEKRRQEELLAEKARKEKEEQELKKQLELATRKCSNGNNDICIKLASLNYQLKNLDQAILFAHQACINNSSTGCKLHANYIQEKNGKEIIEQQEEANRQSAIRELYRQQRDADLRRSVNESQKRPRNTTCKTKRDWADRLVTNCTEE